MVRDRHLNKIISTEQLFEMTKNMVPNLSSLTYSETLVYTDDIEEDSIAEHLEPAEVLSKEEIANFFIAELKRIKNKII